MNLRDIEFNDEYRSLSNDVANQFYVPALSVAVRYDRAVGWFSSSALQAIVPGIAGLVRNRGRIRIVASPHLSEDDVNAISRGYEARNAVIQTALMRSLVDETDPVYRNRLNILANLIASNVLDIRIAVTEDMADSMFHEKMGLIYDRDGNVVAFAGSMNESETAMFRNYEAFDVFRSWDPADMHRVDAKESAFAAIWDGSETGIRTFDFPEVKAFIIRKYRTSEMTADELTCAAEKTEQEYEAPPVGVPCVPRNVSFHDYQRDAIAAWHDNGFRGVFDMATGTGKTYTGLGALVDLYSAAKGRLAVVICCPYQHLVEQWVEDILQFNIRPIIAYSASSQKDWKQRLDNAVFDYELRVPGSEFFCLICTNATYASSYVQSQIAKIHGPALFMVDEAHNFGASRLRAILPNHFPYRLALSATIERHSDEEGTAALFDYFGEKCIEYLLDRAIAEGKLTEYNYHPIIVTLTDVERSAYDQLTVEIGKCIIKGRDGKNKLSPKGERLVLKRARLTAAAVAKLDALRQHITPYRDQTHILVYCGAASLLESGGDDTEYIESDLRQIDAVTELLGNELGMKVSQFTSKEKIDEREVLKTEFAKGEYLQALIAIRCLDEGVNIPKIKTAFILASTTNPKEYIQRRGRVLRISPGKTRAEIFDFVILPHALEEAEMLTQDELRKDLRLVENELARVQEFARLAVNYSEGDTLIRMIKEAYRLDTDVFCFVTDEQTIAEGDY